MEKIKTIVDVISPGNLIQKEIEIPFNDGDIEVKVIQNGICKSDIRLFQDKDPFLGDEFSGHEGIGVVLRSKHKFFKVGDIVATFWHPCYTDHSVWKGDKCISINSISESEIGSEFVVQPVACVINAIIQQSPIAGKKVLVLGSGYFAFVIDILTKEYPIFDVVDFYGHYNVNRFDNHTSVLKIDYYDLVIDVSGKYVKCWVECLKENGEYLIVANNDALISIDTWHASWKNVRFTFPSPRNPKFIGSMVDASNLILQNREKFRELHTVVERKDLLSFLQNPRQAIKGVVRYASL